MSLRRKALQDAVSKKMQIDPSKLFLDKHQKSVIFESKSIDVPKCPLNTWAEYIRRSVEPEFVIRDYSYYKTGYHTYRAIINERRVK